jgi:hypothetical protein
MRLFSSRRLPEAGTGYAGPPAAAMRGRAAEISDAGALPWDVLWEALKLDAAERVDDDYGLAGELGLGTDDWRDPAAEIGTRMTGVRNGRQVEIRIGHTARGLNVGGVQVTWVRAATQPFGIRSADGILVADDAAAAGLISGFAPSRAWDDVTLHGGPAGIVARRPIAMRGQQAGFAYDLWLCERLAGALGAPLPHADLSRAGIPYDMV